MSEETAFEAFVRTELGDIAVKDGGKYISPKINNYWRVWQAAQSEYAEAETQAQEVCHEVYQVVGCLLSDTGQFDTKHGNKVLDNLSECRRVHDDVLPWESIEGLAT